MTTDIFIRSYYKDFRWLRYCLASVAKHAHGFRRTVLVVPASSAARLARMSLGAHATIFLCPDYQDDYLGQQITKLCADEYTDADFICHLDADCILRRAITPEHLVHGHKPVVITARYEAFPQEQSWQKLSQAFMKHPVEYDFMRRQPLTFPKWLYPACRRYAETHHGALLASYVCAQPPRGFSDYNALGALAYYHYPQEFTWQEQLTWAPDETLCRWYWSWEGVSPQAEREITAMLA